MGSGTITGPIFAEEHWDGSGRPNRYVPIDWDALVELDDRIDTAELELAFPAQHWHPQGSGTVVRAEVVEGLEALWADHLVSRGFASLSRSGKGGQGWQDDPVVRKAVEDAAQDRLEQHYRDNLGWHVEDVRYQKRGYDALATKDGDERYLEAKGTLNDGTKVSVSRAEVNFARSHPGQCVMGILSDIQRIGDHDVDPASGTFRLVDWNPIVGDLDQRHVPARRLESHCRRP